MASNQDQLVEMRLAHLNMIQGAITRMSGFSASAKTFTVTVLAGLAAISTNADKAQLGIIALLAVIVLAVMDVYYLTLEGRFRNLYEQVERRPIHASCEPPRVCRRPWVVSHAA
ncbi:hypothetical protein, partial [uncultured Sphingomonas sp.]|uniref:hypothetical protein n=1 Tax=uncultured Sphingomonas sp. TaxID=158754 RepID=UPI0035CB01AC